MANDQDPGPISPGQTFRWLEPLAKIVPETVKLHVEVSGAVVLIALVALVWLI